MAGDGRHRSLMSMAIDATSAPPHPWSGELNTIRERLRRDFEGRVSPEVIDRCLWEASARLQDARITAFVPILVEKNARAALHAIRPGSLTVIEETP